MVPLNLHLQEVASTPVQNIRGIRLPLLHAAAHLGLNVVTSAPFFQVSFSVAHLGPSIVTSLVDADTLV